MSLSPQVIAWNDEKRSPVSRRNAVVAELTRTSGVSAFRVSGDCMAPVLEEGETVEITAGLVYFPGEVLGFLATDGRLLVHRLLGYDMRHRRLHYVTGADASTGFDDPVTSSNVLGRVTRVTGTNSQSRDLRIDLSDRVRALSRFVTLARLAIRRRWSRWRRGKHHHVR